MVFYPINAAFVSIDFVQKHERNHSDPKHLTSSVNKKVRLYNKIPFVHFNLMHQLIRSKRPNVYQPLLNTVRYSLMLILSALTHFNKWNLTVKCY